MSKKIAILYSTVDGQTLKISKFIEDNLIKKGHNVQLFSMEDFNSKINNFDIFIIGASIRYGVHNQKVIDLINTNQTNLESIKTAFFSVNLVARKPEKSTPTTNPYVVKFLKSIQWKPTIVAVFAGNLDYQKYPFFDRIMIQFIMWMTKGPTNSNAKIEYTDWKKVESFCDLVDL
ncbi:MAG: menaquinone-dependent protoporphyrinogen IX dehydrogenase [Lutibacter sp.]|nr:menaquinone-dependent protoporphyrinogen IX dehydrogenase [Lutibacter sp.]MBP9601672.1 menaquinone-dependent protoporphyrinogen IX dehydrogenase [Lutibacter sp.]